MQASPRNRFECDECEDMIPPKVGETDMGVSPAPTLPEGECATGWLSTAVEPVALHHQSDFEMVTWLMKGPVPLGLCAGDKVLRIPAKASSQFAFSNYSTSGRGDTSGPRDAGISAYHGYAQGAAREPQRTDADKRARVEPIGALSNTLLEFTFAYAVRLV